MERGHTKLGEASAYIGAPVSCCMCKHTLGGGGWLNVFLGGCLDFGEK